MATWLPAAAVRNGAVSARATNCERLNARLPGRYGKMTAAELDAEVAKFDEPFVIDTAKPLTPA